MILGFKTGGLWGLRRLIPGAGLPPGADHSISDRRLRDWLQLLDLRIHGVTRYFFRWPLPGNRGASSPNWERRGQRLVAGVGRLLYAHRAETSQHANAGAPALAAQTESGRGAGRYNQ